MERKKYKFSAFFYYLNTDYTTITHVKMHNFATLFETRKNETPQSKLEKNELFQINYI